MTHPISSRSLMLLLLVLAPDRDAIAQQPMGHVRGLIVEARTGAPLAAVLVQVQATRQRAYSDLDGRYELRDVPAGPQTLVVSVVGFGLVRREIVIVANEYVDLTIPVAEGASTYVEEVTVLASPFREAEPGVASQSVLGSRDLLALRGLMADDPFRAVQVLPGVSTGDDFRAEFAVRGLGPSHIGIAVDGVDSPLLFHTVRGVDDTGSLALINSDILDNATLLAGPHPERLGSHLGSRLDFTTRDGARDRLTVRALVSASAVSGVVEGPLGSGSRAGWLVAARRSYIDWLLRQIDTTDGTTFGFTDAQGKLTIDLSPRQTLRVSLVGGRSVLSERDDVTPGPNTLDRAENRTLITNLKWQFAPSAKWSITQQVYLLHANYRNRVIDGRLREEGSDRDVTWRATAAWAPRTGHNIEGGAQAQSLHVGRLDRRLTTTTQVTVLDARVGTSSAAGWLHYRWTPTPRLVVSTGGRVEHWNLIDRTEASPWLLADFEVNPSTRLRFGAGLQRQAPTIDQALLSHQDAQLATEKAATYEVGLEHRFGSAWRLSGSVYRRDERDRLRDVDSEIRLENNRVVLPRDSRWENALSGDGRGVELTLERKSANGLNGWLSYAWNHAVVENGVERFDADFDQRHTANAYLAYRWSGRTSLSGRIRYGSNFPIVGYIQAIPTGYALSDRRNGIRLPEYLRVDFRADRTFTYRKSRLTLFLEVINVLNRENFRYNSPGVNVNTRRVIEPIESLFPLLPVAGVLIEF